MLCPAQQIFTNFESTTSEQHPVSTTTTTAPSTTTFFFESTAVCTAEQFTSPSTTTTSTTACLRTTSSTSVRSPACSYARDCGMPCRALEKTGQEVLPKTWMWRFWNMEGAFVTSLHLVGYHLTRRSGGTHVIPHGLASHKRRRSVQKKPCHSSSMVMLLSIIIA